MTKAEMEKELEYRLNTIVNLQTSLRLAKEDELDAHNELMDAEDRLKRQHENHQQDVRYYTEQIAERQGTIIILKQALKAVL